MFCINPTVAWTLCKTPPPTHTPFCVQTKQGKSMSTINHHLQVRFVEHSCIA